MQVKDVMAGLVDHAPDLLEDQNPFRDLSLLIDAQITRITVDVLAGTAAILLELRHVAQLPATTGMLRIAGLAQQNWVCTTGVGEFTAWTITGTTVHQNDGEFHLTAQCLPAGALRIVGASAEFLLLQASTLTAAPPDYRADTREVVRAGVADENTYCEIVGIARSVAVRRV